MATCTVRFEVRKVLKRVTESVASSDKAGGLGNVLDVGAFQTSGAVLGVPRYHPEVRR